MSTSTTNICKFSARANTWLDALAIWSLTCVYHPDQQQLSQLQQRTPAVKYMGLVNVKVDFAALNIPTTNITYNIIYL
jgi:hypothetical protein